MHSNIFSIFLVFYFLLRTAFPANLINKKCDFDEKYCMFEKCKMCAHWHLSAFVLASKSFQIPPCDHTHKSVNQFATRRALKGDDAFVGNPPPGCFHTPTMHCAPHLHRFCCCCCSSFHVVQLPPPHHQCRTR